MVIRLNFEEALNAEFRWPVEGDVPFISSASQSDDANIAAHVSTRLILMREGYKKAADRMVLASEETPIERDYLIFPIIFNYRQYLELALKYHLAMYGYTVQINANWRTHELTVLWSEFLAMLELYGSEDPDDANPIVGKIILEFAKIDPKSYSYRYPVDRQGNALPLEREDIHLPTLMDVMQAVGNYFTGCDGYLDSLQSAGP